MLDFSKLRKLSDRIYTPGGNLSLRPLIRMLRNMPKLVETTLAAFAKVDRALNAQHEKVIRHHKTNNDDHGALRSRIESLEATIENLSSKNAALEGRITERMLAHVTEADQKRDFQIALLSYELQIQLNKSGDALLRKTCFTDWWWVLKKDGPHEAAFRYLNKIQHLPVTLLDIGANTGISALSVHKCAPNWPIISIEGLTILEPMLKLTQRHFDAIGTSFEYKICGLGSEDRGIQNMHVAIADGEYVDQMATFSSHQFQKPYIIDHLDSKSRGKWDGRISAIETEVKKLDSLNLDLKNPAVFIKMDVEGFELEALPGMRTFLQTHKPGILMETDSPEEVAKLLETMGYMPDFFYYSEADERLTATTGDNAEAEGNFFFFTKDCPMFVQN